MAESGKDLFGMTLDEVSTFARGERLGASKMNEMVRVINRNSAGLQPPSQIDPPTTPVIAMFTLRRIRPDHLVCRTWDGTNAGGEDVNILKPVELRRKPYEDLTINGFTYAFGGNTASVTRNVTRESDDESEDQVIVPAYDTSTTDPLEASVIFAVRNVRGGFDTRLSDESKPAEWMDLNTAGRAWSKEAT